MSALTMLVSFTCIFSPSENLPKDLLVCIVTQLSINSRMSSVLHLLAIAATILVSAEVSGAELGKMQKMQVVIKRYILNFLIDDEWHFMCHVCIETARIYDTKDYNKVKLAYKIMSDLLRTVYSLMQSTLAKDIYSSNLTTAYSLSY